MDVTVDSEAEAQREDNWRRRTGGIQPLVRKPDTASDEGQHGEGLEDH
jgi:hypothetical protein